MQPFIILHTNDIHGRIEGLARIYSLNLLCQLFCVKLWKHI